MSTTRRITAVAVHAALTLSLAACHDSPTGSTAVPTAFHLSSNSTSGTAGLALAQPPSFSVTDAGGNAVSGVAFTVAVTGGGGTLAGTPATTSNGATSVGTWTLGKTVGVNTLTVSVNGMTPFTITAQSIAGAPAAITVASGANQSAPASTAVPQGVVVHVADQFANATPNIPVTFAVTAGGGALGGAAIATTDATGNATAPAWTLGNSVITQTLQATAGSASGTVSATVASNFHPQLRFFGPTIDPAIQLSFTNALARLKGMVVGGLTPITFTNYDVATNCELTGVQPLNETVTDVIIYATVTTIDGVGKILGSSGPCLIRNSNKLSVVGVMTFDVADFQGLKNDGRLDEVVFHEMLHVLGFGTIWTDLGLIVNAGTSTSSYTGLQAILGCQSDGGGQGVCLPSIPLETSGGSGTADGHWRKTVFTSELMTGYIDPVGMTEPLSSMTIASLKDLGYTVNASTHDVFHLTSGLSAALLTLREAQGIGGDALTETLTKPRFDVTTSGTVRRIPGRN